MKYLILFFISFSVFATNFKVDISHSDGREWKGLFKTIQEAEQWKDRQMLKKDHTGTSFIITNQTESEQTKRDLKDSKKELKLKISSYNCTAMSNGFIKDLCFLYKRN